MGSQHARRQIACEAARILCYREESQYHRAKWKAILRVGGGPVPAAQTPALREIRAAVRKLQDSLERDLLDLSPEQESLAADVVPDRFRRFETLLLPLEQVRQDRRAHPEGDVLYHSLQVFDLARAELPYDEEFLLAALLHDVGKAIDRKEHVAAGLDALAGAITSRTAWFIEHHAEAVNLQEGSLGSRSLRRLQSSENFDELLLLADCDRRGRIRGVMVPDITDALQYIAALADEED
jgi:hypothetical protein